jgi:hypothetical protein
VEARPLGAVDEAVDRDDRNPCGVRGELNRSPGQTTAQGRLVFHMFSALAEFERSLIQECTQAGLAAETHRRRHRGRQDNAGQSRHRRDPNRESPRGFSSNALSVYSGSANCEHVARGRPLLVRLRRPSIVCDLPHRQRSGRP